MAKGQSGARCIRTVEFGGQSYRELIVPLPKNSLVGCYDRALQTCRRPRPTLFIVNITGQINELHRSCAPS